MLIIALVLAVIGLAALVAAVVTSNELIAWVCIGASGLGVLLLIVDAVRDRSRRRAGVGPFTLAEVDTTGDETPVAARDSVDEAPEEVSAEDAPEDVPEDAPDELDDEIAVEDHPDELVHDEPDYDTLSDDEPDFPEAAEEAAVHTVSEDELLAEEAGDESDVDDVPIEVRYESNVEDTAATVVYESAEGAETVVENLAAEDQLLGEEQRGH